MIIRPIRHYRKCIHKTAKRNSGGHTRLALCSRVNYRNFTTSSTMTDSVKKSSIYTKTGDSGTSSLFSGERRKKDDIVFEALGTLDELNAHIGVAYEHCVAANNDLADLLTEIQSRLLDIGSHVATPRSSASEKRIEITSFSEEHLKKLEQWIDQLDQKLPPLRNFILPSGGLSSAHLHVARAVCRRAERRLVPLLEQQAIEPHVYKYINRLSDFFFVAARTAASKEMKPEVLYKKAKELDK